MEKRQSIFFVLAGAATEVSKQQGKRQWRWHEGVTKGMGEGGRWIPGANENIQRVKEGDSQVREGQCECSVSKGKKPKVKLWG